MDYEQQKRLEYLKIIAEASTKSANRLWWIKWILLLPIVLAIGFWVLGAMGLFWIFNYI